MKTHNDFGLIGLAVMRQNRVLNIESRGFSVSVYNRTPAVADQFVAAHPGKHEDFVIDRYKNWTLGCISMKNDDVIEVYGYTGAGTKVTIKK